MVYQQYIRANISSDLSLAVSQWLTDAQAGKIVGIDPKKFTLISCTVSQDATPTETGLTMHIFYTT